MKGNLSEEDKIIIEEVNKLHLEFKSEQAKIRCEEILAQKPYLYQVRTIYAFHLICFDLPKSYEQHIRVLKEEPHFFQNTAYLLDQITTHYENKGKDLSKVIKNSFLTYEGEKDGYYFISYALFYRMQDQNEECLKILLEYENQYKDNQIVYAWFQHQLGCHYFQYCEYGDDETNENVANSISYFKKSNEIWPNNTFNITNLGNLYSQMDQEDKSQIALEYYEAALKIYPNDNATLINKGNLLLSKKQYKTAYSLYKTCMERNMCMYCNTLLQISYLFYKRFNLLKRNFDEEIVDLLELLKKSILIEPANSNNIIGCFNLFYHLCHRKMQFKYLKLMQNVLEEFMVNDPLSLSKLREKFKGHDFMKILEKQQSQKCSQMFSLIIYQREAQQFISFQQNHSHYDLFID